MLRITRLPAPNTMRGAMKEPGVGAEVAKNSGVLVPLAG